MSQLQNSRESIAFIGVGRMGGRMAARLLDAGYVLRIFDPMPEAVAALVARGAVACKTASDASTDSTFVILSLPAPSDVRAAVMAENGVLAGAKPGTIVIDCSTIDPSTAREMSTECETAGVSYVDAPVSGGVAAAAAGTLTMMIGAKAVTADRIQPLLRHLAARIVHTGPVGSGQMTKLCNNMLTAINTVALGEVLVAGVHAGLDLDVLCDVLAASSGGSKMLEFLAKTLFTTERPSNFALQLMHKDISLFLEERQQSMPPLPLSHLTREIYSVARGQGLAAKDSSSVIEFFEQLADVRLTSKRSPQTVT